MATDNLTFRPAIEAELPIVIAMLIDDSLGKAREAVEGMENYRKFFDIIDKDPNNSLMVVERDGDIAGTFQISFLPNITFGGSWRVQVEGVRVASSHRGQGLGAAMMDWIVEQARARDCIMVQLTTNKERTKALDFYRKLGFVASHEGFKKMLR